MDTAHRYGCYRTPCEIGQGPDALIPDVQCHFPDDDRNTDGDDDHPQDRGADQPPDENHLDERPHDHGDNNSKHYGQRQGHYRVACHGDHAAEHHKLTLGEIDDPRRVVDDVEAYGDNGVNNAVGYAGNEILKKEFYTHTFKPNAIQRTRSRK